MCNSIATSECFWRRCLWFNSLIPQLSNYWRKKIRTFNLFGSDLFCVEFRLWLPNFLSLVSLFVSQENSIFQMAQSSLIVSPMVGIWTPIAFWNLMSKEFENFGIGLLEFCAEIDKFCKIRFGVIAIVLYKICVLFGKFIFWFSSFDLKENLIVFNMKKKKMFFLKGWIGWMD